MIFDTNNVAGHSLAGTVKQFINLLHFKILVIFIIKIYTIKVCIAEMSPRRF